MTFAVALPAIVLSYFNLSFIGFVASLGAMTVSNADVPGPVQRRFYGMIATTIVNFCIALIIGFVSPVPTLVAVFIAVFCFGLTIVGVYGSRVNTVGFAGLIIMVLTLDTERSGAEVINNALYLLAGSVWYILLSLVLFRMRPYRIIQQALGDYIFSIGDYLKTRSYFYDENVDYDRTHKGLMQQQQQIHEKQEMLREMIFKSRSIVRQSTTTSRTLLIIFIDTIDLFEKATGTVYNYQSMHKRFDHTGILKKIQSFVLEMVDEIHEVGLAVASGRPSVVSKNLDNSLNILEAEFEKFVDEHRVPENIEPLLNMRKVMQSVQDMTMRIFTVHHFTRYDRRKIKNYQLADSYEDFVEPTHFNIRLLKENLSLKSGTFRHALRVSTATTLGYLVALWLNLGHSYWVLLTILVILKPSYSLSKQRNYHRLLGTMIGAVVAGGILLLVHNQYWLMVVLIVLMLLCFSFIRTKYFTGVIFMTAYLIIFFFMLDPQHIVNTLENRIVDTAVGSVIAFFATLLLAPSWERHNVKNFMEDALEKSAVYFKTVADSLVKGRFEDIAYRLSRKEAFVAQTNLSGGFSRMLNEPKSKQHKAAQLHQFTVLINVLNSHIVTLADFIQKYGAKYATDDLMPITYDIVEELAEAKNIIANEDVETKERVSARELRKDVKELVERRHAELQQGLKNTETKATLNEYKPILDQFLFISRIAGDLKKLSENF